MQVMKIESNVRDYTVNFSEDIGFIKGFDRFPERLFVIDSNVWRHYGEGYLKDLPSSEVLVFPVSEERKSLHGVTELYDLLMEHSAKKNMTLISIGGGIIQDITGFVASTLYRGINWVFVPTTLLAQADSCIGSKTSLNYKGFKNLVGTFYPPAEVHVHVKFLATLENEDFYSGLGEVVKLHLMGGSDKTKQLVGLLPLIAQREAEALSLAVRTSLDIKLSYMAGDEFDTGRRNLLNFGHCFGHAIESVSNYKIPHGQAVVIGMLFANIAARNRGLLSAGTTSSISKDILINTITVKPSRSDLASGRIMEAMKKDKKRIGEGLVIVLMKDDYIFEKVTDFREEELLTALEDLMKILNIE